jgi:galactose oxidase
VGQKQSLLYDPGNDTWTPMASQTEERGYHSTALLLPDGRVLSAGDNQPPGGGLKLEIYSPPYLFQGSRPTITSSPATATWGSTFTVETPDAVARAVLMRSGSTTHTLNMNQRHVELAFTTTPTGILATAPPSAEVAPPGYYLLFLLDGAGTPSVANWIRLL